MREVVSLLIDYCPGQVMRQSAKLKPHPEWVAMRVQVPPAAIARAVE